MPNLTRMPASIAAAIGSGMRLSAFSNQPVTPASTISAAENTKAPMASGMLTPESEVIRSAAPGVDHAVTTGTL
ncbi:hypothetical protein D3C72_1729550 [compost metagenome]